MGGKAFLSWNPLHTEDIFVEASWIFARRAAVSLLVGLEDGLYVIGIFFGFVVL